MRRKVELKMTLELVWSWVGTEKREGPSWKVCLNACEPGWKLDGGGGLGEGAEILRDNTSRAQRKRKTEDSEWHGLLHLQDDEVLDALDLRWSENVCQGRGDVVLELRKETRTCEKDFRRHSCESREPLMAAEALPLPWPPSQPPPLPPGRRSVPRNPWYPVHGMALTLKHMKVAQLPVGMGEFPSGAGHACWVSHWTCQASPSVGFSRQEYWSGLPFPPPGILPNQGLNLCLSCVLHWQAGSLPLAPPGKPTAPRGVHSLDEKSFFTGESLL